MYVSGRPSLISGGAETGGGAERAYVELGKRGGTGGVMGYPGAAGVCGVCGGGGGVGEDGSWATRPGRSRPGVPDFIVGKRRAAQLERRGLG